jgi:hypothetical protein
MFELVGSSAVIIIKKKMVRSSVVHIVPAVV